MNTTIDDISTLIHDLLAERDYQGRNGASPAELEQMQLAIDQLQVSRALMVAYAQYGLAAAA
jgi:hypothetical protein